MDDIEAVLEQFDPDAFIERYSRFSTATKQNWVDSALTCLEEGVAEARRLFREGEHLISSEYHEILMGVCYAREQLEQRAKDLKDQHVRPTQNGGLRERKKPAYSARRCTEMIPVFENKR